MIEKEGKHYLYRHIRLDTQQPFYIGIGHKSKGNKISHQSTYYRAYNHHNRNKHWRSIVDKFGYEVEILLESDDYEFIKQKEIEFIALYGRRDIKTGILVNLTDGGDGSVGFKHTQETLDLLKVINASKGRIGALNPAAEKVIDTLTLKIYDCAKDAAISLGYPPKIFRRYISINDRKNPTYCVYLKNYVEGEIHYPEKMYNRSGKKVKCTETGIIYRSVSDAAVVYNMNAATLRDQLRGRYPNKTPLILI